MVSAIVSGTQRYWTYGLPILFIGSTSAQVVNQTYWTYGLPTQWLIPSGTGGPTPTGAAIILFQQGDAFISICYPA